MVQTTGVDGPTRAEEAARIARRCGLAGAAGVASFWTAVVALQLLRTDLSTVDDFVSDYANGPWGWVLTAGVLPHGLGNLAIAAGLGAALGRGRASVAGVVAFAVAAAGLLLAGVFRTDPAGASDSVAGDIHGLATNISFGVELVALLLLALAFARHPSWRGYLRVSSVLALVAAAAVLWLVVALRTGAAIGLAERVALGSFTLWEFATALRLVATRVGGRAAPGRRPAR